MASWSPAAGPATATTASRTSRALRRFLLLRRVITALGIEPDRLQLVWASAAEGERLAHEIGRIVEEVRALGPLDADERARRAGRAARARWRRARDGHRRSRTRPAEAGGGTGHDQAPLRHVLGVACGGCDIAVLNVDGCCLDVDAAFEIVFWPAVMDAKYADLEAAPDASIDITLFSGGIRNTENEDAGPAAAPEVEAAGRLRLVRR